MAARLKYPKIAPKAYDAMIALGHYLNTETSVGTTVLELIKLRASLINGCDFCIQMHIAEMKKHHEPDTRIEALKDWQSSDAFTPKERAALAWTDALTTLEGHAPDEVYDAARAFFEEKDLLDLTFAIAQINAWNRLGIAFRAEWKAPVAG